MIHCAAVAMLSWLSFKAESLASTASSLYAMFTLSGLSLSRVQPSEIGRVIGTLLMNNDRRNRPRQPSASRESQWTLCAYDRADYSYSQEMEASDMRLDSRQESGPPQPFNALRTSILETGVYYEVRLSRLTATTLGRGD
jgi:hypothetical protein